MTKLLIFIWILAASLARADDVALMVSAYRPGENSVVSYKTQARRFERAFASDPQLRAVSIALNDPADLEDRLHSLKLSPGDRITRLLIDGHGSLGCIGGLDIFDPEMADAARVLDGKFSEDLVVHVYACAFVPKDPAGASFVIERFLRQLHVRKARAFAYFDFPSRWGRIMFEPAWALPKLKLKFLAVMNQLMFYVAPVGVAIAAAHEHYLVTLAVAPATLMVQTAFWSHLIFYSRQKLAYAFDVAEGRAAEPVEIDLRGIRREFYGLECEHLFDEIFLP